MRYASTLRELWQFMRQRKKLWLLPLLLILLLLAILIMVTSSTALAPFIYPLF